MLGAMRRMNYPKVSHSLTLEQRRDLVERLMVASAELQSLAADDQFRFQSLTGSVARLVHDWCVIVGPDLDDLISRAANDTTPKPIS